MEGFYIVYLFATDGSAVYLSLNQGTSEYRSNAMRPVNDRAELRALQRRPAGRSATSRGIPLMRSATVSMHLTWASTPGVGRESRQRTRNYEDANIIASAQPRVSAGRPRCGRQPCQLPAGSVLFFDSLPLCTLQNCGSWPAVFSSLTASPRPASRQYRSWLVAARNRPPCRTE
jgi:MrcB-like, N-terminal domain